MRRQHYLGTPLFALLDFGFGFNVRAVFVESSVLRAGYYLIPMVCGLIGWKRPGLGPRLGMIESGFSLACIIIGVWLAVFGVGDAIVEGRAVSPLLSPRGLANVVLSGGVLALSFYGNQAQVMSER